MCIIYIYIYIYIYIKQCVFDEKAPCECGWINNSTEIYEVMLLLRRIFSRGSRTFSKLMIHASSLNTCFYFNKLLSLKPFYTACGIHITPLALTYNLFCLYHLHSVGSGCHFVIFPSVHNLLNMVLCAHICWVLIT